MTTIALTNSQISFFKRYGHLELEGLFSESDCAELLKLCPKGGWKAACPWKQKPFLLAKAKNRQAASILGDLFPAEPAFRLLSMPLNLPPTSLGKDCCFQGSCLLMQIPLAGENLGRALLFSPDFAVPALEGPALYILYGTASSIYRYSENDPEGHLLKKQGYVFGDLLRNETHPQLTR